MKQSHSKRAHKQKRRVLNIETVAETFLKKKISGNKNEWNRGLCVYYVCSASFDFGPLRCSVSAKYKAQYTFSLYNTTVALHRIIIAACPVTGFLLCIPK